MQNAVQRFSIVGFIFAIILSLTCLNFSLIGQAADPVNLTPPIDQTSWQEQFLSESTFRNSILLRAIRSEKNLNSFNPNSDYESTRLQASLRNQSRFFLASHTNFFFDGILSAFTFENENTSTKQRLLEKTHWKLDLLESYFSISLNETLTFQTGKKVTQWGTASLVNPIDILGPSRNIIDPSQDTREGSILASVEKVTPAATLTALAAFSSESTSTGVPKKLTPEKNAFAMRAVTSVQGADLTAAIFYTNEFNNAFKEKPSIGLAFSKLATDSTEFHGENLIFQGSARSYAHSICVQNSTSLSRCVLENIELQKLKNKNSKNLNIHAAWGTRTHFANDSMLLLELIFFSDGDTFKEYDERLQLVRNLQDLSGHVSSENHENVENDENTETSTSRKSTASAGSSGFQPSRKWYSSINYTQVKITDDLYLGFPILINLEDLSSAFSPRVTWNPEHWLQVAMTGTFFSGPPEQIDRESAQTPEFLLSPVAATFVLEAKAYF